MTGTDWRADTVTSFPAITDDTPPPPGMPADATEPFALSADQPCPCGSGKTLTGCDGRATQADPGTGCLLSCAPGVTSRMWRTRVTTGEWDDILSLLDSADAATHIPALQHQRLIHAEVAARRYDIAVVFTRTPSLLCDRVLGDGLRDMAARLAERLADMRATSEERWAA
jgi:hypothetical protein